MSQPIRLNAALLAATAGLAGAAAGQVPYSGTPDWISSDHHYATGCGLADLDRDGWQDLVVANGNDINRERVIVYYNRADGTFPQAPDWSSSDVDYNGHLSIGDVNGDGWPDVAVAVYLGPGGFSQKGHAKLYLNDGTGTLASTPSWRSQDDFYSFSLALGDADGDGDLDLAVATGEAYYNAPDRNRIYFNVGGNLTPTPGWLSAESDHSMDVAWGDLDSDGDLDLAFCNAGSPARIYYSSAGTLQTGAGWSATSPASPNGNTIDLGDIDGDGFLDLAFSDNSQLGGSGRFLAYLGDGAGGMGATPAWQSDYVGYVSGLVLFDAQGDGLVDLVGGSWWGPVQMYLNDGTLFPTAPDHVSNTGSVVEAIPLGDPDKGGVAVVQGESHAAAGVARVFYFEHTPVLSVESVLVDGAPLAASQYAYDPEAGWISLAVVPSSQVTLDYTYTSSIDFAISNWDGDLGNYLFYREGIGTSYCSPAVPNSTGLPGVIRATGSTLIAAGNVTLTAAQLPAGEFGYFLVSQTQGSFTPPGSSGVICLGGNIGRFNQPGNIGQGPTFSIPVDPTSLPVNPPTGARPGESWNFQCWYRDAPATSNFTDAVTLLFQ